MKRLAEIESSLPEPIRSILRGVGQVFFQDNAITGALFLLGIFFSSPLMALGGLAGSAIGYGTARLAKLSDSDIQAGIHGFNPALVGIATFFFFQLGLISILLLVVGSVVATFVTFAMRKFAPFPTYTSPFIVTTWGLVALGKAMGAAGSSGQPPIVPDPPLPFWVEASAHGVGQVMFQGSLWTGILFLVGIAISNRGHAAWVLVGSVVGALAASHQLSEATRAIDPERLVDRTLYSNILLGLYGYNATLAPVALYLWRRSLIAPLLGMLFSVPLLELVPRLGIPALTAPFVLATWLVLVLEWAERKYLSETRSS